MALTRKFLKAMGIEDEKIDEIIEAHRDTVDPLKAERDKYKENSDKLEDVQKKYDDLKNEVESKEDDPYKEKYEKEHKDFEDYKKSVEEKETKTKKISAYKSLLKEAGVNEKRIDAITKITSMDDIELDDEGNIKDADKLKENIKSEYSEFIVSEEKKGADTPNPPKGSGVDGAKNLSRAAQVAQRYNERMYGVKGDNK